MNKIKFDSVTFKNNLIYLVPTILIIIVALFFSNLSENLNQTLASEALPVSGNTKTNKLIINEIMANNGGVLIDGEGQLYDWLELYNGKDYALNLANYALSDNNNQIKWVFPEVTIEAKGYLIVYLAGKNKTGLYTNFKLKSSGGEDLILRNSNGKVLDAVTTTSLQKNEVMFRNLTGAWHTTFDATPGYSNSEESLKVLQESIVELNSDLKINELLVRNKGNFKNNNDEYSGYIELINTTNHDIDLGEYSLSNNSKVPFMWVLPKKILAPNEVFLVYTSGLNKVINKETHTSFTLNKESGAVVLAKANKIVGHVEYHNLPAGIALINDNDNYYQSAIISPGYPNDTAGVEAFNKKYNHNPEELIINEVMSSNYSYLPQNGSQFYDWIELKNNTDEAINLSAYYLTTNTDNPSRWQLPNVTIKPNEYYIVMASGDINLSNNSYIHSNFNIGQIQSLYLYKNDNIVDSMFIANIPSGYSYGRGDNNGFYYYRNPTPKQNNLNGLHEISYNPIISVPGGVYNNIDQLKITLQAAGAIYYTLDGSNPTISSNVYNKPLLLDKTTVLKAVTIEAGKYSSNILTNSYIINENHTLPVLSVSMVPSDFNKVNTNMNAMGYEMPANAELYEDNKSFSIPCGIKLFGGSTRFLAKKSYALNFRKKYGASTLNYQLFSNRDFSTFNSLVVRSGSQDYDRAFFRDILMTSLVDDYTDLAVQAYKTVILYINGSYWGLYNIREKVDEYFIASNYNVDPANTNILRLDGEVKSGTAVNYQNLLNYIRKYNLAETANYEYIKEKIDINNLIDYWIAETWPANWDTVNVRFFQNPNIDNNRWKYIYYDLDFAMYNIDHNYYNYITNPAGMTFNNSTELLRNLMKNKEFKTTFLERLSYQLNNVWTKKNVLKRIDEIYNNIKEEMPRERTRWKLSIDDWDKQVEKLKKFANERPKHLLATTKSFFNLSQAEMERYFGDVDA